MGFASMFEDIIERLGGIYISLPQAGEKRNEVRQYESEVSQPENAGYGVPPLEFQEKASQILLEAGIPHYLIGSYINWVYRVKMGERPEDQIFDEFIQQALPLIMQYLRKGDTITSVFVRRLLLST